MSYYATKAHIYEVAMQDSELNWDLEIDSVLRLELLYGCLGAIKTYFQIYETIESSHHAYFPFNMWQQSRLMLHIATRLAGFQCTGWNLAVVRAELSVENLLDADIERLQDIMRRRDADQTNVDKDVCQLFLQRTHRMKEALDLRAGEEQTASGDSFLGDHQGLTSGVVGNLSGSFWEDFNRADWMINAN
jgi:hypothetical protein